MTISYAPLRNYLANKGLSPNRLYKLGIITTNAATAINNDRHVSLRVMDEICTYLRIPIEQAVEIIPEDSNESAQ